MSELPNTQWWLVELHKHGSPSFYDVAHNGPEQVIKVLGEYRKLGLDKGMRWAIAELRLSDPDAPASSTPSPTNGE